MCGSDAGVLQKRGLILARFVFVVYSVLGILRCVLAVLSGEEYHTMKELLEIFNAIDH